MPLIPRRVKRIIGTTAISVFAAQVTAASAVMVNDHLRKRRKGPPEFPHHPVTEATARRNEVTVYSFGEDLYPDMLAAIDAATERIYFETFIWKGDEMGRLFKQALIRAAERGVEVYVVYDTFANMVVDPRFFELPKSVHVKTHPLIQSAAFWNLRYSGRDHRKLLVVDGEVAFMGGYNIGSLYADSWRDTHGRFVGPCVTEFENAFIDYWNMRPVHLFWWRPSSRVELPETTDRDWGGPITLQRNVPRWSVYPIRNMYLEAIDRARKNIWLTTAYLIPDDDFRTALGRAAKRGVDVRIIVPAESNHILTDWLSRGFYSGMLRDGIRLFLFQNAMVHAKTATIDGQWSTIGTANLDRLSLVGNYEINAEIISPAVAAALEEVFVTDLTNCREIDLESWERRSPVAKFTEGLLAPWRPFF
ncbi:MAG: phosphatidylserine/phosphatidylglycerophosphate/cardiolipin synthase family protein [Propionibacteriaceae bacterium]|nr:phosphatidylserine/phosphatidylglycerophosphate/cardiolipin synthase family protein [Propionibacteriaceae bacterium]